MVVAAFRPAGLNPRADALARRQQPHAAQMPDGLAHSLAADTELLG